MQIPGYLLAQKRLLKFYVYWNEVLSSTFYASCKFLFKQWEAWWVGQRRTRARLEEEFFFFRKAEE